MNPNQDFNYPIYFANKGFLPPAQNKPASQTFNQTSHTESAFQTYSYHPAQNPQPSFPVPFDTEKFVSYSRLNDPNVPKKDLFDSYDTNTYLYKEPIMPPITDRTMLAPATLKVPSQNDPLFSMPLGKSLFDLRDDLPLFQNEVSHLANKGFTTSSKPITTFGSTFAPFPFYQPTLTQPSTVVAEKPEVEGSTTDTPNQELRKVQARLIEGKLWTEDDDKLLLKFAIQCKCDWKKVVRKFKLMNKKVTPNFLKLRYKELIAVPVQRRNKFSHTEDLLIAKYFRKYGTNWDQIASHFKKRSGLMLKNRYYSAIRVNNRLEELLKEVDEIEANNQLVDDLYHPEEEPETFEVILNVNEIPEEPKVIKRKPRSQPVKKSPKSEKASSQHPQGDSSQGNTSSILEEGDSVAALKEKIRMLEELFQNAQLEIQKLKSTLINNSSDPN